MGARKGLILLTESHPPILVWLRRDLRLADNPALDAAVRSGRPVIAVFIRDAQVDGLGAAPKWRLGLGLGAIAQALAGRGARLILRSGEAGGVLRALMAETGATAVFWNRLYDPEARARDTALKAALRADGAEVRSFNAHLLFEPWDVQTGPGGYYRVYTPFWRAVRDREVPVPLPAPAALPGPAAWPATEALESWQLGAGMARGADVVQAHVCVGEDAGLGRLGAFIAHGIDGYAFARDRVAESGTSRLSENLTYGEISPRTVWHAGARALAEGRAGAETFLKELAWREFSYHLLFHTPQIATRNWRPEWDAFPWHGDGPRAEAWRRGRTGVQFVDAAMREMYVTGTMHNRARMIVASYLTKHLLTDWRIGLAWFADCLIDWDPAANAMGWQWAAGSGPDAAPYFRVFNPDTQAEKFDPDAVYRRRFIAEISRAPGADALAYFRAIPASWALGPDMPYPAPIVGLKEGREAALAAYKAARA
jgi:deoxyribodipyrimidine photo-lyase